MTKQEIECHFLQQVLCLNIIGFSFFDVYHPTHIYAYQQISFELHLKGSCISIQKYTEPILDLTAKEGSKIKGINFFEAASVTHLNLSNSANQKRQWAANQKALLPEDTSYLRWVIPWSLEVYFLIGIFEDQS